MARRTIDYYFTVMSPWAYLGHAELARLADRHGATVRHRPVPLGDVFEATGSLPLAKRPVARQRYRWIELQRWRDMRGLPLTLQPKHWPVDPTLANLAIVALESFGRDPHGFAGRAFAALWAEDQDIADRAVLARLLEDSGHPADTVLEATAHPSTLAAYDANRADAIAVGVFGAPAYVLDGEVFWGQDRLDLLADALVSGRAPYRPL